MPAQDQLSIISVLRAKPGMEERLEAHLLAIVPAVRRSVAGLINLDLHRDLDDASVFVLYENWATTEAFEAYHRDEVAEDKAFRAEAHQLLAGPISPQRMRMLTEPGHPTGL